MCVYIEHWFFIAEFHPWASQTNLPLTGSYFYSCCPLSYLLKVFTISLDWHNFTEIASIPFQTASFLALLITVTIHIQLLIPYFVYHTLSGFFSSLYQCLHHALLFLLKMRSQLVLLPWNLQMIRKDIFLLQNNYTYEWINILEICIYQML